MDIDNSVAVPVDRLGVDVSRLLFGLADYGSWLCFAVSPVVSRKRKRTESTSETLNANPGFVWGEVAALPAAQLFLKHESDSDSDSDSEADEPIAAADDDDDDEGQRHSLQRRVSKRAKRAAKRAEEQTVRLSEQAMVDGGGVPTSADGFDRLLMGSPHSSYIWVQYAAFFLQVGWGDI